MYSFWLHRHRHILIGDGVQHFLHCLCGTKFHSEANNGVSAAFRSGVFFLEPTSSFFEREVTNQYVAGATESAGERIRRPRQSPACHGLNLNHAFHRQAPLHAVCPCLDSPLSSYRPQIDLRHATTRPRIAVPSAPEGTVTRRRYGGRAERN
jgi:hypothetical protein